MKCSLFATAIALTASATFTATSIAAPIDPGLTGDTSYDGWDDLTNVNFPNRSQGGWDAPIGSNQPTSGDAEFDRIWGTAYPYEEFIYSSYQGAGFEMVDASPLPNLATVVFQIDIGEAVGIDIPSDGLPVLSYNGGTEQLTAVEQVVSSEFAGTFSPPIPGAEEEPLYRNTLLFQWDLSDVEETIESFSIVWTVAPHTQVHALRLDQSDVFIPAFVPEPASLIVLSAGSLLMMRRRRNA